MTFDEQIKNAQTIREIFDAVNHHYNTDEKLSFVDKPGMRWVDIPETTESSGMKLCTAIGKQGGWCTQGESLAKSYGSRNAINVVRATVKALASVRSPEQIAAKRGKSLDEIMG